MPVSDGLAVSSDAGCYFRKELCESLTTWAARFRSTATGLAATELARLGLRRIILRLEYY
jgi:hypothetical protein